MKKILLSILCAILVFGMVGTAVALAIADPDTPPQVNSVYVYEDCLEDGDVGVLIDYFLNYTTNPTESATDAYLATFVDTDNITHLETVSPYTYQDNGYGRGLIWIYFTPAEVTAYGLTSANEALYRIWFYGNPSLSWTGDPPFISATIDFWQTAGDTDVLLALRVLYYADLLELTWSLDLIETTPLGSRLTTLGSDYFENVIQDLRLMAPACFPSGTYYPTIEDINYSTSFNCTISDDTGTLATSPTVLTEGANTVAVTATGNFTVTLSKAVSGNVTTGTCAVTGSPVDVVEGSNTVNTAGAAGNIIVTIYLFDTRSRLEDALLGTGLDLTTPAAMVGMTRLMFSGLVWMIVTVLICAAVYKISPDGIGVYGGGKIIMLVFQISIIGGALLGLLHPLVAALLFIGFGAFTGYVIFFRQASI